MAFSYDITGDAGKVRLLANDQEATNYLFEDDEIEAFLALEASNVLLAAALALDTIAGNEALIQKKLTTLAGAGIQTDGPAVAKALREGAANLRARAEEEVGEDPDGMIDIAEIALSPFGTRERMHNEWLRERV